MATKLKEDILEGCKWAMEDGHRTDDPYFLAVLRLSYLIGTLQAQHPAVAQALKEIRDGKGGKV